MPCGSGRIHEKGALMIPVQADERAFVPLCGDPAVRNFLRQAKTPLGYAESMEVLATKAKTNGFRGGALAGILASSLLLSACGGKETGPEPTTSPNVPDVASSVPAATANPDLAKRDMSFAATDTNGDGLVASAEYAASSARIFKAMDTNADGNLTVAELDDARVAMRISGGPSSEKLIERADNDGDRKLTLAEFIADVNRRFALIDLDKSGSLTPAEYYAGHPELPDSVVPLGSGGAGAASPITTSTPPGGSPPR